MTRYIARRMMTLRMQARDSRCSRTLPIEETKADWKSVRAHYECDTGIYYAQKIRLYNWNGKLISSVRCQLTRQQRKDCTVQNAIQTQITNKSPVFLPKRFALYVHVHSNMPFWQNAFVDRRRTKSRQNLDRDGGNLWQ